MIKQPKSLFVKDHFDEFKDTTDTLHINKIKYKTSGKKPIVFEFRLTRVKQKEIESLRLWCVITKKSGDMLDRFDAASGELIFRCDQENIPVKFRQVKTSQDTKGSLEESYFYFAEHGPYTLEPSQLKKICDAKQLKIRISGGDSKHQLDEKWCIDFQRYCKQFYNNVYDPTLYLDAVAQKPGCFIATAAMGAYDDPAVQSLSQFRDDVLLNSFIGRQFVRWYYSISPAIAAWMTDKKWACTLAKNCLVLPASKFAKLSKRN